MDPVVSSTAAAGGTALRPAFAALAQDRDLLVGIGPFVIGLVITGALIAAVWLGTRLLRRQPPPPRPEEQPHPPPGGPVGEVRQRRRPAVFRRGERRRYPHELHPYGTVPPGDPDAAPPDEPSRDRPPREGTAPDREPPDRGPADGTASGGPSPGERPRPDSD